MHEYFPIMTEEEISLYIRVGEIIDKYYLKDLFKETLAEDIISRLPDEEKNEKSEKVIKELIFNRQLMAERFL